MPVLENLRKGTDSTSTRLFIGFVVAVFVLWGAGSATGGDAGTLAEVNGVAIKQSELNQAMQLQRRRADSRESDKELAARVLTDLIEQEALLQEADRMGIAVSGEEVARELRKIEIFEDESGAWSEKKYKKYLKGNQTTAARFEESIWRQLLLEKLIDLAARSVVVTDAELRAAYVEQETKLDLSFVRLTASAFLGGIEVTDADIDALIQQNPDKIKAQYDQAFERFYNLPRRYQLSTILLRTDVAGMDAATVRGRAEEIRAEAVAGADFAVLARRWSEDLTASSGGGLGLQAADQLDPAITAAADAAGAGNVTAVTETGRGLQILRVEKIEEAKVIPLEEARRDIARSILRDERAPAKIDAFAASVIAAWQSEGAPPRALLDPLLLGVDSTGPFSLADDEVPRLGDAPELRAVLPTATPGQVLPVPIEIKGATYVIAVASRTEADMASFEAQSTMLRGQVRLQRQSEFIQQWQADVLARATVTHNEQRAN